MFEKIVLHKPYLIGNEKKYLYQCIKDNWITSGKFITKFEDYISNYLNINYAISCINGTSALHIALKALNVKINDEVIVPTITFIAPINSVSYNNAIPVFMDCDEYGNMDPYKIIEFIKNETFYKKKFSYNKKTKRRIFGIIIVHVFGNAANIEPIISICKKRNIKIIEDASESLGTYYTKGKLKNKFTGTIGDIGCLSFNGNKILTTGGGGMIISRGKIISNHIRYLINQAKNDSFKFIHNDIGFNYRMSNLNAAIGCAQFEKFQKNINIKNKIHNYYSKKFNKISGINLLKTPRYSYNNKWLNIVKFDNSINKIDIKKIYNSFKKHKIGVRKVWYPNHLQKPYKNFQRYNIHNANLFYKNCLCIPSGLELKIKDLNKIIEIFHS